MVILQKLRAETSIYHRAVEDNPLLKKLTKNLSLEEYIHILEKFYSFYQPFENSLDWTEIKLKTDMKVSSERRKTQLLEKDLGYFKVALEQIPLSPFFTQPLSFPALLGCFYVLEGSCHGRKMMWPSLSAKLNLQENKGGAFFYDCVDKLPKTWTTFCEVLNSKIKSDHEENECVQAAVQTFQNIDRWFKD